MAEVPGQEVNAEQGVFQGLTIVDVSGSVATSYAAKLFADYGALVINLEPAHGFATRKLSPLLANGDSAMHAYLNTNKHSVVATRPLLSDEPVLQRADLVIYDPESLSPAEDLSSTGTNTCAISWYGLSGPTDMSGSDATIHALSGLMRGIGSPEGLPLSPGVSGANHRRPQRFNGALGHLLAQRMGNCDPFQLDASILEANMCFTDLAAINAYLGNPLPPRMGINRFPPTYPLGIWPCKDGWLGVTNLTPGQWKAFCKLWNWNTLPTSSCFKAALVDWSRPIFLNRKYWLHYPITVPRTCSTADRPCVFL